MAGRVGRPEPPPPPPAKTPKAEGVLHADAQVRLVLGEGEHKVRRQLLSGKLRPATCVCGFPAYTKACRAPG